ncbi:MAG: electron transfer flavoprotein subunit alpha/FixB family protein [Edaphobacter sp.]
MILIVAEHANGKVSKSTWEMVTAARELAQQKGSDTPVTALVLGSNIAPIAAEIARAVDQVLVADLPALAQYDSELWSAAVAQIAREGEASVILIGASRSGREYSPRVAIKLDAPLLEDVISLKASGETLTAQHYTFLARVTETIETAGGATGPIAVVTIKPGVFNPAAPRAEAAEQFDVDLNLPAPRLKVTGKTAERSSRVSLAEAEIVISGGRGVGSAEGFTQYVEALADQLGAAVGATRAIVDAGWRPYSEQVGQTGKTVQPRLYIAIGISGAVQHLSGMNKSKIIVAINRDAEAPIFKIADYGIIGDVPQLIPAILTELKK